MKRHPALQDLSRDHHRVLYQCQQLRRALARPDPWPALQRRVHAFLAFYESDMGPHMREEDEIVIPLAQSKGDRALRDLASATLEEHRDFRRQLEGLGRAGDSEAQVRALLSEFEPSLTRHVQREEAELFEGVQSTLSESELKDLWAASYRFRRAHRAPDACGAPPGGSPVPRRPG